METDKDKDAMEAECQVFTKFIVGEHKLANFVCISLKQILFFCVAQALSFSTYSLYLLAL